MTVHFTPRARDDLRGIRDYLESHADLWIIHIRHSARRPFDVETSD